MVDEYIRKQDAADVIANTAKIVASFNYQYAIDALKSLEPVSVVEVVRCKDCQYLYNEDDEVGICYHVNGFGGVMPKDGFCSKGERRT